MTKVLLQCSASARQGTCGVCQDETTEPPGCQLTLDSGAMICIPCARRHSPILLALVGLSQSAERAGRIAAHGIFPPMTALLELAKAAEEYSARTRECSKNVA